MTRVYYKEAVGAFLVFDVSTPSTFNAVVKWKHDLDTKVCLADGLPIPCLLLANKCDEKREGIAAEEAQLDAFVKENNFVGWYYVSAKENINVEESVKFLVGNVSAANKKNCSKFNLSFCCSDSSTPKAVPVRGQGGQRCHQLGLLQPFKKSTQQEVFLLKVHHPLSNGSSHDHTHPHHHHMPPHYCFKLFTF